MRQGDRGSHSFLVRYIAHAACVSGTFREIGFCRSLGGILLLLKRLRRHRHVGGAAVRGRKRIAAVYREHATHKGTVVILSFFAVCGISW